MMQQAYGNEAMSHPVCFEWNSRFRRGGMSMKDEEESSSSLEKLEDREAKETQEKEEKERAKKELEYHMEAYVEGLNTDELFITMFKDDKEGLALLEMNDDAKDLQKIFHDQMMEVIEQLFSIGLRQHKVREEEMTLFIACVNKAKEENRLNSQHLMEEFLVKKAGVFHNIHELAKTVEDQNEEDLSRQIDEMQKHTDSYHEFCQKTWYDLMEAELTLFEQLEETNGNFERNLNDLVGSFIEQAQSLFTHIRNLEQNFSEQLNECATHYLTNLNVRLEDRNLNVPLELIPMQEVRKVSEEKALDVVCLQEPYSTRNGIILQMPKEARIILNGKAPMNVTIVLNRHITVMRISQFCNEKVICVEIQTGIEVDRANVGTRLLYNLKKADWEELRRELQGVPVLQGDNINLKVKELTWALQAAMRKTIPVMKEVTRCVGNRPWNEQLQKLCVWPLDLEVQKRATGYWLGKGKLEKVILLTTKSVSNKGEIRETLLGEWQADWEESNTGRRTFQFFPNKQERLILKHLQPSQGLVHYITGSYQASLFRMNLSETSLCCCGGEAIPEHMTLECIFMERERAELLMPIQATTIYHILRDVDRWSYLDEIAERDRHMDELKERRQIQDQDFRQNRQEETTEEEVTSEYNGDEKGEATSDSDEKLPNW
uniref:(California timema) hypothetical protein n=1 Tax=Timema californicum TaxID=61474 RepID=A0A7R9P2L6_TIMCA|nr:unnamed protein product [Timema californicum]